MINHFSKSKSKEMGSYLLILILDVQKGKDIRILEIIAKLSISNYNFIFFNFSRQMHFCGICSELMNRKCIGRHCEEVHNRPGISLKVGETPSKPRYFNWAEFVEDPANVNPEKIPDLLMRPQYS